MVKYTYEWNPNETDTYKLVIFEKQDGTYSWTNNDLSSGIINVNLKGVNGELPLGFLNKYLEIEFLTKEIPQGLFDILLDNSGTNNLSLFKALNYTSCKLYENGILRFAGALVDEGQITEIGLFKDGTFKIKFIDLVKVACESIPPEEITMHEDYLVDYNPNFHGIGEHGSIVFYKGDDDERMVIEDLGFNIKYCYLTDFEDTISYMISAFIAFQYYGFSSEKIVCNMNFPINKYFKILEPQTTGTQTDERGAMLNKEELVIIYERGATPDDSGYNIFDYIGSKYKNLYDYLHDTAYGQGRNIHSIYSVNNSVETVTFYSGNLFETDKIILNNTKIENPPKIREIFYDAINVIYNFNENDRDVTNVKSSLKGTLSGDEFTAVLNFPSHMNSYKRVTQGVAGGITYKYVILNFNWMGIYYLDTYNAQSILHTANDKIRITNMINDYFAENDYRNILKPQSFNYKDYTYDAGCIIYQNQCGIAALVKIMFMNVINNKHAVTIEGVDYNNNTPFELYRIAVDLTVQTYDSKFQTYYSDNTYFINEFDYDFVLKSLSFKLTGMKLPI